MTIPVFDGILNVIPPHRGDPTSPMDVSPYPCSALDLVDRFSTSPERKAIIDGFLRFREELLCLGIRGIQWIDGSFLEDVEADRGCAPGDIDVVTMVVEPFSAAGMACDSTTLGNLIINYNPMMIQPAFLKSNYSVAHYWLPLGIDPRQIVFWTKYWYGLFSHRKRDGVWKGMLEIALDDPAANQHAITRLRGLP